MEHLSIRKKVTIMFAIMASMLFASLNQTIVGTIVPRIVADLKGIEWFEWVFTIYMLTSSVTAILVGKLSDLYGRKPFFLVGLGIFMIGSFLCGTATTMLQLIIYRGIQGIGGGMVISTSFTAVGDLFSPRERGRWQGWLSATFGLASILGPVLGGYIVDHMHWHWCFWIFLPVGIVAFFLIWFLFPTQKSTKKYAIDYFGSFALTMMMIPFLLAFSWAGSSYAWTSPVILGLFATSAFALVLFIWIEKRAENPVLPLPLFKNSVFTISNLLNLLIGFGMFGAIMYTPFFVQGVMGLSATLSSILMIPMTVTNVVASIVTGQIVSRTGKYKMISLFGLLLMMIGLVSMSLLPSNASEWQVIIRMIVIGIGLGIVFPIFTLTVQNAVEHKDLGVATSSTQLFRQMGGTIGVSVLGTIMTTTIKDEMTKRTNNGEIDQIGSEVADPQLLMDPNQLETIRSQVPVTLQTLFDQLVEWMREALTIAIHHVFIAGGIVLLLALVLAFFVKELPLRTSNSS